MRPGNDRANPRANNHEKRGVPCDASSWNGAILPVLAGPSLAWAPVPPMHVLLAVLLGSEKASGINSPLFEPSGVIGWEI